MRDDIVDCSIGFMFGVIFGLLWRNRGMIMPFVATLALVVASDAAAQQAIIYGSDGKRIGTAQIDSQGTTTTRNAAGTVIARETLSDSDKRIPHTLKPADLRKPHACPFKPPCFEIPTY